MRFKQWFAENSFEMGQQQVPAAHLPPQPQPAIEPNLQKVGWGPDEFALIKISNNLGKRPFTTTFDPAKFDLDDKQLARLQNMGLFVQSQNGQMIDKQAFIKAFRQRLPNVPLSL